MNNTFSIQRFGLLLKRQWLEFGKIYLISLAVVLGIFLSFYGYNYYAITNFMARGFSHHMAFRIPLFIVTGLIFITIIGSNYFAHLGQKPRAIIDLLVPTSTFEKLMGGILFTSVLGILSYLLLFYLTDLAFMTKLRSWYETSGNNMFLDGKKVELSDMFPYFFTDTKKEVPIPILAGSFLLTSIFLLGSIYFEKFHYIKTTIVVMIFSGIWTAIIAKFGIVLFEGKTAVHQTHFNDVSKSNVELLITLLLIVLTLIFWSITYVRLKEKEV
jgi:hypothetical protein